MVVDGIKSCNTSCFSKFTEAIKHLWFTRSAVCEIYGWLCPDLQGVTFYGGRQEFLAHACPCCAPSDLQQWKQTRSQQESNSGRLSRYKARLLRLSCATLPWQHACYRTTFIARCYATTSVWRRCAPWHIFERKTLGPKQPVTNAYGWKTFGQGISTIVAIKWVRPTPKTFNMVQANFMRRNFWSFYCELLFPNLVQVSHAVLKSMETLFVIFQSGKKYFFVLLVCKKKIIFHTWSFDGDFHNFYWRLI